MSGLSWGAGDFSGGLISRYTSTFTAVMTAQLLGLVSALALLPISGEMAPSFESVAFALVAGALGVSGLFFFYYALGRGTMGVIAPLAALIGAGVPVLLAIYNGEHVSPARLIGIILALAAVALISLPGGEVSPTERRKVRIDLAEIPLVVLAGLGFAGFFVFIGHSTADGGVFWPLTIVRTVGAVFVVVAFVVLLMRMRGSSLRKRLAAIIGVARLLDSPGSATAARRWTPTIAVGGGSLAFMMTGAF